MIAVAATLGISQFFLVQWVAPFLSELPEFVSTFGWARRVTHAPMALMTIVSSNFTQWTILAAMIPLLYGFSHMRYYGVWSDFTFDIAQRNELALTLLQTMLGVLLLANLEFDWMDAAGLFVLWVVQFTAPHLRAAGVGAYRLLAGGVGVGFVAPRPPFRAARQVLGKGQKKRTGGASLTNP